MPILYLLLLILFAFPVQASKKAEIDSLHQRAYRLLDIDPDSAFALGALTEVKAASLELDYEEAESLFIQAYIYRQKNELGKAFALYLKALKLLRPLEMEKARLTYTKILLNTGVILDYHSIYPQAIQYYDEGIRIAKEYNFRENLLKLYYNKAEVLRQEKKFDQALTTIESVLNLAKIEADEDHILSSFNQRGLILKDMGRYEEARANYQEMINFKFNQMSPEEYKGQAWHNMAVTYLEEENYDEAVNAYLESLKAKEGADQKSLFITWMDLGETYYLMGKHEQAHEMTQKALAYYDEMLLTPDHYAIFDLLSKITVNLDECHQSHAYSQRFLQAQQEIQQIKDQYKMEMLTANFFQELENSRIKRKYQTILAVCVGFLLLIIAFEKARQYYIRQRIKKAILQIERESEV